MNKAQLKQRIIEAIRAAQARGYVIKTGSWGVNGHGRVHEAESTCLCPMGAVILGKEKRFKNDPLFSDEKAANAALELGASVEFVQAFISGFDSGVRDGETGEAGLGRELGVEIRREFANR
jgi:hypothetical protein